MTRALVLVLLLAFTAPAWAQQPVVVRSPASDVVALTGIVVIGAGFGMMLHGSNRTLGRDDERWFIGGLATVGAGVTLVYLGLRSRTVVVVPTVTPERKAVRAVIRWGR